ncbi:hypothetical protein PV08_06425 [Exophiala spinifera]|uniref:Uncharacterized protein n=1 Tax=Exophiala spinifera TaxID=91928 RepID=A0A0D2BYH8_9EURO|nr:uncharacterized protein PV08_06425 [Exophiala spinifera]KIW16374.1 hypothetical protein PV08_06425 [Exophiala spinifera]
MSITLVEEPGGKGTHTALATSEHHKHRHIDNTGQQSGSNETEKISTHDDGFPSNSICKQPLPIAPEIFPTWRRTSMAKGTTGEANQRGRGTRILLVSHNSKTQMGKTDSWRHPSSKHATGFQPKFEVRAIWSRPEKLRKK